MSHTFTKRQSKFYNMFTHITHFVQSQIRMWVICFLLERWQHEYDNSVIFGY